MVTSILRQQAQKTAALEQESPAGFCSSSRRQVDRSATWWPATSIASAGAGGNSAALHSILSSTEVLPAVFNALSAQKRVSKGCGLTRHLERHCICPLFTCFPNPRPAFKGTRRHLLGLPHLIPMALRGRGASSQL